MEGAYRYYPSAVRQMCDDCLKELLRVQEWVALVMCGYEEDEASSLIDSWDERSMLSGVWYGLVDAGLPISAGFYDKFLQDYASGTLRARCGCPASTKLVVKPVGVVAGVGVRDVDVDFPASRGLESCDEDVVVAQRFAVGAARLCEPVDAHESAVESLVVEEFPDAAVIVDDGVVGYEELLKEDGYCYVAILEESSVGHVVQQLGSFPTVEQLLRLDVSCLRSGLVEDYVHVTMVGDVAHLRYIEDKRVRHSGGSLLDCIDRFQLGVYSFPVGSLGARIRRRRCGVKLRGRRRRMVDSGRAVVLSMWTVVGALCDELGLKVHERIMGIGLMCTQLSNDDFTVCKCRVHAMPRDLVAGAGCSLLDSGKHGTIRAAVNGWNRYCHATEDVRRADRRFLELVMYGNLKGACDSTGFLSEIRPYVSSNGAPFDDFGKGYCYLLLVRPRLRWRVARLLGPCPMLADLYRVLQVASSKRSRRMRIVKLIDSVYHVVEVVHDSLEFDDAGREVMKQIEVVLLHDVAAVVGVDPSVDFVGKVDDHGFEDVYGEEFVQIGGSDVVGSEVGVSLDGFADLCVGPEEVSGCVDVGSAFVPKVKVVCGKCNVPVNPRGHALRCGKRVAFKSSDLDLSKRAWLGHPMHRLDVRRYIIMSGVADKLRGSVESELVSRAALASWYLGYSGIKVKAGGTSEQSLAVAFGASYVGEFRRAYIRDKLDVKESVVIDSELKAFFMDDGDIL